MRKSRSSARQSGPRSRTPGKRNGRAGREAASAAPEGPAPPAELSFFVEAPDPATPDHASPDPATEEHPDAAAEEGRPAKPGKDNNSDGGG